MTVQRDQLEVNGSEPLLKLITVGRKSRIPHVVATRFVQWGGSYYLLAGRARSDWALNALDAGTARVRQGQLLHEVSASLATAPEMARTLELFSRKYGKKLVVDWYSKTETCLKLTPTSLPSLRGEIRGEGAVKTTFAEWKRSGDYYSGVAEAFDSASEEYDFTINGNFINRWIRERSIRELLKIVKSDDVLLEIGCGTGAEAIQVSKHVSGIVATDISPKMISLLKRKIDARGLQGKVLALQVRASEVRRVANHLPQGRARVAYSFNGALNCEPELERFPRELATVVEEGGYFLCSIRNSLCLSEALAHGAVLQFDRMAPRKRQPVMVSVGGMDIPSYYYRPARFAGLFAPHFRLKKMIGLPAVLPPAYLSDIYFRARRFLAFAERMETAVAGSFPFNRFGDQTLFLFQKRPTS